MMGKPVDTKGLVPYEKAMKAAISTLEAHFLGDKEFIGGSTPTIADLSAFCEVQQLQTVNVDLSAWPKLFAWMERMRKIPHYNVANKFFDAFVAKQKQQEQEASQAKL
jgi:glutathione S-transferase